MPFTRLPTPIAEALAEKGYAEPTAVQGAVLQDEARGRDLIVSAQTGSGKTVAFGVAMAEELLTLSPMTKHGDGPLALIIAPTRELALQVAKELVWLFEKAGLRIATCVGGMDPIRERRQLSQGVDIVVGTPGRLRDHLERGALDLSRLAFAVLDEADEMLDMGFREDLEELLDATPGGRRTLLFSATMPKPILALAKRYQRDALQISTIEAGRGHGDITYHAVTVAPADIEHAVVNLLRYHESHTAMLFCATRENVRRLHGVLAERGFAAVALSGEHSQNERNHALQALRDGRARVCVATDVAARGIDIATLDLVIHVELPRDAETLQHRSGRTGRAGRKGTAVLVVPYPRRRRVEMMLRSAKIAVEWREVPGAAAIREQDRARLVERLSQPTEVAEDEQAVADHLLELLGPQAVALALVRAELQALPQPEDLIDISERTADPRKAHHREGFDDTLWFRMDVGRRQNADPRWILPLLCRRGHVTKGEIGAIRILPNETWFQVPRAIEAKFKAALKRTGREGAEDESGIAIEQAHGTPPELQRGPRGGRPNGSMQRRDFREGQGDRGHRKGPRGPGKPPRA
ncbi:DEAD/DEAH box helicase [Novosphingobium cyanobacteriorum]|uniref:DEAD/DEAH box helicase n=1 Tax=Novosphingobium cyanobacteriorum TaxID=3024215 RepID=A0ABT6CKC2_9SPHN|nr:DEAD/DEAH box helicase [Novosphingobium cyanobacteriorum]MDF8334272.1 DEAD/DEAH box helicase [Novosphingobium cyanobacteriorum]